MRLSHALYSTTPLIVWSSCIVVVCALSVCLYDVLVIDSVSPRGAFAFLGGLLWLGAMLLAALVQGVEFRRRKPPLSVERWSLGAPVLAAAVLVAVVAALSRINLSPY